MSATPGAYQLFPPPAQAVLQKNLRNGDIRCVITTSPEHFGTIFDNDAEIMSKIVKIGMEPPSPSEAIEMLRASCPHTIEAYHKGMRVSDAALLHTVQLAARYMPWKSLPGVVVNVLDEACSLVKIAMARGDRNSVYTLRDQQVRLTITISTLEVRSMIFLCDLE